MTPGVSHGARVRAYLSGAIVTLGLLGVGVRAWALQVDDGQKFHDLAEHQHEMELDITAPRGEIVDADGRQLAASADADSVWASPHDIKDLTATSETLGKLLGLDASALEAKLGGDRRFVWLARHVPPEVARAVAAAKLPGVEIAHEPRRWYPGRALAGTVIGRTDIDGSGKDGIEKTMNAWLAGKSGEVEALRDARGRAMMSSGVAHVEPGATVHLSLDRSIQAIAESSLAAAVTAHKAKSGVAVVLEVGTSRVIALASYPSYDPNTTEVGEARDRPVTDLYEAGSVMKMFTVSVALDDGAVTPETGFDLGGGQFTVGHTLIRDVDGDPYLTVAGIIKRSSNVGAAKIALRLGREKLYAGLKNFGFGARTGIELPAERWGTVHAGSTWRDVDLAHIAFGYGLTVTPLQIAAGLAAIGNGGMYREPRIVDQVDAADGTVLYKPTPAEHRAISDRTAMEMVAMLTSVFDKATPGHQDGGTAKEIDVPGFKCGGKTGTAHKYDPTTKKYSEDRYLSSFAGLAPISNPRLAIVVMIDEPNTAGGGDYYGAKVAAPVFATIASESLRYLGVPGDAPMATPAALAGANPAKPAPPVPADRVEAAPIDRSAPPFGGAGDPEQSGLADAIATVPDFRGLGVARALELARDQHVDVDIHGSGRMISQDPPPGPISVIGRVSLTFSDERSHAP